MEVASLTRIERATPFLGGMCSILLSYRDVKQCAHIIPSRWIYEWRLTGNALDVNQTGILINPNYLMIISVSFLMTSFFD